MAYGQANRGRAFEEIITWSNRQYRERGLAVIHKVPTAFLPIRGRPDPYTGKRPIVTAKVEEKAAVDFLGIYRGLGVAFDAKECRDHRWPLRNLEPHQAEFLRDWHEQGGIAFILIAYWPNPDIYLVPWWELGARLTVWQGGGEASIAREDLARSRPTITAGRGAAFDYLAEVDRLWVDRLWRLGMWPNRN